MTDTPERDVRDRLAEALWLAGANDALATVAWVDEDAYVQETYRIDADCLLESLSSVGLAIAELLT